MKGKTFNWKTSFPLFVLFTIVAQNEDLHLQPNLHEQTELEPSFTCNMSAVIFIKKITFSYKCIIFQLTEYQLKFITFVTILKFFNMLKNLISITSINATNVVKASENLPQVALVII